MSAVKRFLLSAIILFAAVLENSTHAQTRTFNLLTASISDIQSAVGAGALTYEDLVQLYLARIDAYDKQGPKLNAVLQINPKAREIARALDDERRAKGLRSPLHGIPIAIKSLTAPPIGTSDRGPRDNPISSISGLPAVVVPAGVDAAGLPVSIEFLGRPFSEANLLRLASVYEQNSHRRVLPKLTPPLKGEVIPYR